MMRYNVIRNKSILKVGIIAGSFIVCTSIGLIIGCGHAKFYYAGQPETIKAADWEVFYYLEPFLYDQKENSFKPYRHNGSASDNSIDTVLICTITGYCDTGLAAVEALLFNSGKIFIDADSTGIDLVEGDTFSFRSFGKFFQNILLEPIGISGPLPENVRMEFSMIAVNESDFIVFDTLPFNFQGSLTVEKADRMSDIMDAR